MRPALLVAAVAVALGVAACGNGNDDDSGAADKIPQPTQAQMVAAGLDDLPIAPESERLDINAPKFSDPTNITNPLWPISEGDSTVYSGKVEGKPFHTETTVLPLTRGIEWAPGQHVEAQVLQYFAYLDGRIEEVALDYFAQADDGSVWYLGEDVNDYDPAGLVDSTSGSWLAGREGPPEMIMPADPKVGDVHRAENIPAIAFEELTIKTIDKTVDGPRGPVEGAMVASELHDDGTTSDKVFAPGYGEFFSDHDGDTEALALAVPTDAIGGDVPAELESISSGAQELFDALRGGDSKSAATLEQTLSSTWDAYPRDDVPPLIGAEMDSALGALAAATDKAKSSNAAIDVAQSATDLELLYRAPAEIDLARFGLWADQILADAAAGDVGAVRGDVTTMEWIRDRFSDAIDPADLTAIDAHLVVLRDSVSNEQEDLKTASSEAELMQAPLELGPVTAKD